ncbi:NifU family protein [Patescibacteria group bacterium]|nr:NifU family protein [Patescibacteria group bacterium]
MQKKIERVLNEISPYLASHGGAVEFIEYKNHIVKLKMLGACSGCALSSITLKNGIEEILKSEFSEISEVVSVE